MCIRDSILNSHRRITAGRRRIRRNAPGSQFVSFEQLEERALLTTLAPEVPEILTPSDVVETQFPNYSWTLSQGASHYELQVDNLTAGIDSFLFETPIVETSFVSPVALDEGEYRVRVRAVSTTGDFSDWSEFRPFTVNVPTPAIPDFITPNPIGISTIESGTFEFDWTDVPNAASYNLWVTQVENAAGELTGDRVVFVRGLTESNYQHHRAFEDGVYRAWVQAENSVGETSSFSLTPVEFIVDAPPLERVVVTSPTGTSENTSPTFTWSNVEGAVRYELWVNNLTTGQSRVILETELTGLSFTPETPLEQGRYRVWVRAFDVNGETSELANGYSLPVDFTIDIVTPGETEVTGPVGDPVTTSRPTITWTTATNATSYQLWVNNDSERIPRVILETIDGSETSFTPTELLVDGRYKAFVRAFNSAGEPGPWSDGFLFTVAELVPAIPEITAPVVNAVGTQPDPTPTIEWTRTENAFRWDLWVNNQSTGENQIIRQPNLTTNSFTPTEPLTDGDTFVVWVRAFNESGETLGWSEPFTFILSVPTPGSPVLFSPEGTAVDDNGDPTSTPLFIWSNQGTDRYEIFIRNLTDNSIVRVNVTDPFVDPATDRVNFRLEQSLPNGTYQHWVRAINRSGLAGGWSDPRSFVIDRLASLDSPLLQFDNTPEGSDAEVPEVQPVSVAPQMMLADAKTTPATDDSDEVPVVDDSNIEIVMSQWAHNDWWTESVSDVTESPVSEESPVLESRASESVVAMTEESESNSSIATAALPLMLIGSVKKRKNRDNE